MFLHCSCIDKWFASAVSGCDNSVFGCNSDIGFTGPLCHYRRSRKTDNERLQLACDFLDQSSTPAAQGVSLAGVARDFDVSYHIYITPTLQRSIKPLIDYIPVLMTTIDHLINHRLYIFST